MTQRMVTDDLVVPLNGKFRLQLISNFKIIEAQLRQLDKFYAGLPDAVKDGGLDKLIAKNNQDMQDALEAMDDKINRISRGTDVETTEQVVTQILKDKGVIN